MSHPWSRKSQKHENTLPAAVCGYFTSWRFSMFCREQLLACVFHCDADAFYWYPGLESTKILRTDDPNEGSAHSNSFRWCLEYDALYYFLLYKDVVILSILVQQPLKCFCYSFKTSELEAFFFFYAGIKQKYKKHVGMFHQRTGWHIQDDCIWMLDH